MSNYIDFEKEIRKEIQRLIEDGNGGGRSLTLLISLKI